MDSGRLVGLSGISLYKSFILSLIYVFQCKSTIPASSKPFFIILYADKTRLSSFGTEKGYPVLVRCANLPASIRNGTGVGGGRLVGWLPIVRFFLHLLFRVY